MIIYQGDSMEMAMHIYFVLHQLANSEKEKMWCRSLEWFLEEALTSGADCISGITTGLVKRTA